MYAGSRFSPSDPDVESEVYTFDFRRDVAAGETLSSATFSIALVAGSDASPAARLSGAASVSGTKASQRIAGLKSGATYRLQCVATTSLGNTVSLYSFVECLALRTE
jgi:hypothetical protein